MYHKKQGIVSNQPTRRSSRIGNCRPIRRKCPARVRGEISAFSAFFFWPPDLNVVSRGALPTSLTNMLIFQEDSVAWGGLSFLAPPLPPSGGLPLGGNKTGPAVCRTL
jgi:hypothetical protein